MSVWRIGAEASSAARRTGISSYQIDASPPASPPASPTPSPPPSPTPSPPPSPVKDALDKLTKWIPGDALAFYLASVTVAGAATNARPSVVLLIVFIVLTPLWVVGSAFGASGSIPKNILLPAGLATIAFTIWTLSVPFSGWQRWDVVHDHQAGVAIVAAVVAVFFGFLAQGLVKRYGSA
jgi:hypothetical protein